MSRLPNKLSEISAEMLINYLFPQDGKLWKTNCKGSFYRNYNADLMEWESTEHRISLSRDGFLQLLPQAILSQDDELKVDDVKVASEQLQYRLRLLREAFMPIDSFLFQFKLKRESCVANLLSKKYEYILKRYFEIDITTESNPYVQVFALLLPFVNSIKGDINSLRSLLAYAFHCRTEIELSRYSVDDNTVHWLPSVKFKLIIPDLTAEKYSTLRKEMEPLVCFLREWFIPFDTYCEILVIEHRYLGTMLDYNTDIT